MAIGKNTAEVSSNINKKEMVVVASVGLIAVFFAWLESSGHNKHGLKLSFFTIFLLLALRYNYGSDYMEYVRMYMYNSTASFEDILNSFEPGWVFINRLFAPFGFYGFFVMQGLIAVATCIIIYRFIKNYCPSKYYWFAVFFYLFHPYQMLVLASGFRQAVAYIILIFAIDFLIKNKVIHYLIIVFVATLFHKTAFIFFPLVFLKYFNRKISILQILPAFVFFIIAVLYSEQVLAVIKFFLIGDFVKYALYTTETSPKAGLGWALMVITNLVIIYYAQFTNTFAESLLFKIAILSFLIYQLIFASPLITRFCFYFDAALMAVYPITFVYIKQQKIRYIYISIIILFILYQFFMFFRADTWKDSFVQYNTIFSAPQNYY